jgi:carboxylesterase
MGLATLPAIDWEQGEPTMRTDCLHNPQIQGEPFLWHAGAVGVLLVHGFTATPAEVRPLAERLRDSGYSVAGPLLAGHGSEPAELNRSSWRDWLADGEAALRQLAERCDRVFAGGESLGVLVALLLAAEHPEIAGVLGYAPAIRLTLGRADLVRLHLGAPFITQVDRESLDCAERWQGYPGLPLRGAVQFFRMQRAVRRRLGEVRQPVLLMQGRHDTTVSPGAMDEILAGVSSERKEFHWLEASAHPVIIDSELDRLAGLTLDFIGRCLA